MKLNKKIRNLGFTILFPVYNESGVIEQSIKRVSSYLKSNRFDKFEILIADNGSTDNTAELCILLARKKFKVRYAYTKTKGVGAGIKAGINASKFDIIILLPIDLAVNLKFIIESLRVLNEQSADVVIGSKGHSDSRVDRHFTRKIASFVYNNIVNIFFNLNLKDTQGVMTFKKNLILPFLNRLTAEGTHFFTQLVIYSKLNKLNTIEIPVWIKDPRYSTYKNLVWHGITLTSQLIKEFFIIRFRK